MIGGLYAVLVVIISAMLQLCNYNHFDNFVASRLFKIKESHGPSKVTEHHFNPSKFGNVCQLVIDNLLCCIGKSDHQRALERARNQLHSEMNVVELVRALRYFKLACRHMLTANKHREFAHLSRFVLVGAND